MSDGSSTGQQPNLDDGTRSSCLAPTRRNPAIGHDVQRKYWLDVHGPEISALPGLHIYYQYHLDHDRGGNWPALPGIASELDDADQLDGLAELGWASDAHRESWFEAAIAANISDDEKIIFQMVMIQMARAAKTLCDVLPSAAPIGDETYSKVFVALRRRAAATGEAFDAAVQQFAKALSSSQHVQRLRLSLMADFTPSGRTDVDDQIGPERQYQAFIELVTEDRIAQQRLYEADEFRSAAQGLSETVAHINAFPVKATYAYTVGGQNTLIGERGEHIARLIRIAGSSYMAQLLGH